MVNKWKIDYFFWLREYYMYFDILYCSRAIVKILWMKIRYDELELMLNFEDFFYKIINDI